jgi:hypothetical protein
LGKRGGSPNWHHGPIFHKQKGSGVSKRLFAFPTEKPNANLYHQL